MSPEILTMGYTGLKMDKIVEAVMKRNAALVDVRLSPVSRFSGWNKSAFLAALGPRYVHVRAFGNENYKSNGPIRLLDAPAGLKVIDNLFRAVPAIILMCACEDVNGCHRLQVAHVVADHTGFPVYHLSRVDVMGFATEKPLSEAAIKRQMRADAKKNQLDLLGERAGRPFQHRDDS